MKTLLLLALAIFGLANAAPAPAFREDPQIAALFEQAGVRGTFVVLDQASNTLTGHDAARASTRFSPASTFKIPHSLIALDTGAVTSVDEVFFRYAGQPAFLPSWKQDMNLRQAISTSNVLAYQELARRIGLPAEQKQLRRLGYGNASTGKDLERFWLDGALRISAIEQTRFLARLAQGTLPYPAAQQAAVRDISRLESGDGWVLYGKTGWATSSKPGTGWFVGWVERVGRVYPFALNMDITSADELPKRTELARASLQALGILAN